LTRRLDSLSTEPKLAVARALSAGTPWSEIAKSLGCAPVVPIPLVVGSDQDHGLALGITVTDSN